MEQNEKRLKESEERYINLFDNDHTVMLIIDPDTGKIIDANPAACNFYGFTKNIFCSKSILNINMLTKEQVFEEIKLAILQRRSQFYFQHKLANGEIRDVEVYSGPISFNGKQFLYSIVHDVSERKKAEKILINERELFKATIHSMGDGLITTDIDGRILLLSKIAEELTGWSNDEAIGKPLSIVFNVISEKTRARYENPAEKVLRAGKIIQLADHTVIISKDGTEKSIVYSGTPINDVNGNTFGVAIVFRDISIQRRKQKEIEYLGFHDSLTGVYNRTYLEMELKRINTENQFPISLLMGDVNGMKLINGGFGHDAADNLLKQVAEILKKSCRKDDVIARADGDEFVVILPRANSQDVEKVIARIRSMCNMKYEQPIQPSIALGWATKEFSSEDINDIYRQAEVRMYNNKLIEGKSIRSSIISSLTKTLQERTHETELHSIRLKQLSLELGRGMKLHSNQLDELALLALLHDIGKIAIPDNILNKQDELTHEEWETMKKHSEIGYRIASSSPELANIADYILYHHEHWDGKGYPHGLKGEEIPLVSRIISVVDAYDAMTNSRVYRDAMTKNEAVLELFKYAGTQFDPNIVTVFCKYTIKFH